MDLKVGLNPYGIACTVGLVGNSERPLRLDGFFRMACEFGTHSIEFHLGHLLELSDDEVDALARRLAAQKMEPVLSTGPPHDRFLEAYKLASRLGVTTIRVGLTTVLCGDRAIRSDWIDTVDRVRRFLKAEGIRASDAGVSLAIENHQDFGSEELMDLCEQSGPAVGVCLDTGNALAVGENPIAFAKNVASRVRHVHLKDYNAQFTDEGYRLVRCAIGDGAVCFDAIHRILADHHDTLTASLEPGALEARYIRLFTPSWWTHYPERSVKDFAECLHAARKNHLPDDAEWRTPWERACDTDEVCRFEMAMMGRSVDNMRRMGWM